MLVHTLNYCVCYAWRTHIIFFSVVICFLNLRLNVGYRHQTLSWSRTYRKVFCSQKLLCYLRLVVCFQFIVQGHVVLFVFSSYGSVNPFKHRTLDYFKYLLDMYDSGTRDRNPDCKRSFVMTVCVRGTQRLMMKESHPNGSSVMFI